MFPPPPPNLFNTLSPMCYHYAQRKKVTCSIVILLVILERVLWLIASYKYPARDPLKNCSSLFSLDRDQKLGWSRSFEKNFLSDFTLIVSKNRVDRDPLKISSSLTCPDRDHYIGCSRADYVKFLKITLFSPRALGFLLNDLLLFPKTSFHDFHGLYIKS